jgi:hypothetical protein
MTAKHLMNSSSPGDRVVYADSAYDNATIEFQLAAKEVQPQINEPELSGYRALLETATVLRQPS